MAIEFGKIGDVPMTDIWRNEAIDFTPWLAANIDALGSALGLELEVVRTEAAVGDFSCDILAKDLGTNRFVIIENQIKSTDHDHLGKLITYAAGLHGETVIWVSRKLRDEHRQALEWLNERTRSGTDFWGVEVKVIKIDDSKPAFQFQVVAAPFEGEEVSPPEPPDGDELSIGEMYRRYFQRLLDELRDVRHFTNARIAQPQNYYAFSSGITGIPFVATFANGNRATVQLAIQFGTTAENKAFFDVLVSERSAIEQEMGSVDGEIAWERKEETQMSRIIVSRVGSIREDSDTLQGIHNWMVSNLLKFKKIFGPRLHPALNQVRPRE